MEIFYPKRNLSAEANYQMNDDELAMAFLLKWNYEANEDELEDIKSNAKHYLSTKLVWKNEPFLSKWDNDHQSVLVTISHPYLEKDIVLHASYYRSLVELLRIRLRVDYSHNPEHLIILATEIKDMYRQLGYNDYSTEFLFFHNASEVMAEFMAQALANGQLYKISMDSQYTRQYFPKKHTNLLAYYEKTKREVELSVSVIFYLIR